MAAAESGQSLGGTAEAPGMESSSAGEALPGFRDADSFVKHALGTVVSATKASTGLPQPGDEYDFYRSFPGFQAYCEMQGERLLQCMSKVMQYHGCRSHLQDHSKVTELEDKFDLLVDANDVILERVGMLLDEAAGVNKNQQPVLPTGLQPPKTIISSWNRKQNREASTRTNLETFRLLHAKNILRPQLRFREKVDNSNTPFVPKLFIKPNALKPLPQALLKSRQERKERPEDLDVPAALADFLHQQRAQQTEQDMFAHPYRYELEHFSVPAEFLQKPEIQMFGPLAETPCHFVSTLEELVELNEKLVGCREFALDLEHHSYRSFLGLTCLMQISTRTEDFIIDTLELRSDLYILNETFTNPAIVKVLHGADSDVEWLQRDFGLYLVNIFDTHQAARLLSLGRHSLDHLLKLYCSVDAKKQYQLADWRIRPLPEEMVFYAREDTHYLLYIYDRMREALWERANAQPAQLQVVWQRSREICLKKYVKPIFTDDSYLELYRKQKKHLNTQQLTAFRLLFAWRDRMARQEDESPGYVLPNHMLLKIAEELPKEPQGIIACCNPVPPLVRQQLNEMHLLIHQAREMPLLKSECAIGVKKKEPLQNLEKPENHLFGPHDSSHNPQDEKLNYLDLAPGLPLEHVSLFSELEPESDQMGKSPSSLCLLLTASISVFNEPEGDEEKGKNLTVSQQKARHIMESFENPFRMYLPAELNPVHISQAAKSDPSSKIYEISNRWKLLSQAQLQAGAKKEKRKLPAAASLQAAPKDAEEPKTKGREDISVRQLAAQEHATPRRETADCSPAAEAPKRKKAKPSAQPEEDAAASPFTPFDYSKSNLRVFAGSSKTKPPAQFNPTSQSQGSKKFSGASKMQQPAGTKSMSYTGGKSSRGFRHNWPKR